jgi:hypothetical protein
MSLGGRVCGKRVFDIQVVVGAASHACVRLLRCLRRISFSLLRDMLPGSSCTTRAARRTQDEAGATGQERVGRRAAAERQRQQSFPPIEQCRKGKRGSFAFVQSRLLKKLRCFILCPSIFRRVVQRCTLSGRKSKPASQRAHGHRFIRSLCTPI